MGKRSSKCHAHKKPSSPEKNLFSYLRDSFPADESNDDSGLGSDASILFADSNITVRTGAESDLDSLCDYSDLSATRDDVSSLTAVPPSAATIYGRGRMHIDGNLANSLGDKKMHIHVMDPINRMNKQRITSVFSHAEPLAKRRKVMSAAQDFRDADDDFRRENGMQSFVTARPSLNANRCSPQMAGGGVLTEATVCHNALSKRSDSLNCQVSSVDDGHHEHKLPWSSRENFVHSLRGGAGVGADDGGGGGSDRIAALLSVAAQPSIGSAGRKKLPKKPSLHVCFPSRSKELKVELSILVQPEEQHRARYMTEGSRGSIKDENGNGFPKIKLCGYKQPVTLQVFIGSDAGKVQPHLFYQACKVTGKNCTPCTERMIEGTSVIEINMSPENDMTVCCDCIGILKERNVDVEQRLPYFGLARCKKRSTKCRIVFRVNVQLPNGNVETLQIASSQILCTQSPGVPEICKKSLTACSAKGGTELYIIGKNFQKDTKILFQELRDGDDNAGSCEKKLVWEEMVDPEKEFLHQSHLICCVPPYRDGEILFPVKVYLSVLSGGKSSEPHTFTYTPCHSVPNGHSYSGCHSEFRLRSSHASMGFCKDEMLSDELSLPVNRSSPMMPTSVLNSPAMSPTDAMPLTVAMHLIPSPQSSHSPMAPTSLSSSASPNRQFPMSLMTSDVEHHHMQQHSNLGTDCTSVLLAIAEASQTSSSSVSSMTTSFTSSEPLSPRTHAANDLVGHDVDLMKKIDQLACEMTTAEEARCSPLCRVSEVNLSLTSSSQQSPSTHAQVAMANNAEPMFSMAADTANNTMQCQEVGCTQAATSAEPIGPSVSLASIVSAMVTSVTTSESGMFAVNQAIGTRMLDTTNDMRRGDVSAMSTMSSIHQLEHHHGDVKPQVQSAMDVESNAAVAIHEASISFDVHCCSGISPAVASVSPCIPSSEDVAVDMDRKAAIAHAPLSEVASTIVSEVKLDSAAPVTCTSEQQAAKAGKSGAQPDMMTLAFSQLSDADLLSIINPSTFDSV